MKLDVPTNPGFQAGRTTASSIFPLRSAAEHCKATAAELPTLLDDLKWCFGTSTQTVVKLALMRLGVPAFYASMLSDTDVHCARSTVTAHGTTIDIAEMVHRQLHGTGQGTVEGPINWISVAGMIIAIARQRSTQPVTMPTGTGRSLMVECMWFVGDLGLAQAGRGSTPVLQTMVG